MWLEWSERRDGREERKAEGGRVGCAGPRGPRLVEDLSFSPQDVGALLCCGLRRAALTRVLPRALWWMLRE